MAEPRARAFLDQLLAAGRDWAERGEDWAASTLNVEDTPEARRAMVRGLGAGAAAAGLAALLLGGRAGRRFGGRLVRAGAVVGAGALGWRAYQRWRARKGGEPAPDAPPLLDDAAAETRARALFAAMTAAAKLDGHLTDAERDAIRAHLGELVDDADAELARAELDRPADPAVIAALAQGDDDAAREIYAVSAMVCDADAPEERGYLDALARALRLDPDLAGEIEHEAWSAA